MTYYTDDPIKAEAMHSRARDVYVSAVVELDENGHRIDPSTGEVVARDWRAKHSDE